MQIDSYNIQVGLSDTSVELMFNYGGKASIVDGQIVSINISAYDKQTGEYCGHLDYAAGERSIKRPIGLTPEDTSFDVEIVAQMVKVLDAVKNPADMLTLGYNLPGRLVEDVETEGGAQ